MATPHSDSKLDVDSEKGEVAHLEKGEVVDDHHDAQTDDIDAGFDPVFVKQTMRKVDWRLVPILALLYAISLIDRTNLALARAANNLQMDRDIGTGEGMHYSIVTLLFFVPYIIFEVPVSICMLYALSVADDSRKSACESSDPEFGSVSPLCYGVSPR